MPTDKPFEWLTLRTASAVFVTNESFCDNALRRGVQPGKVTVVRNGPSREEIEPVEDPPTGGPYRIVYLGVLGAQDNVEGAVLAAERLAALRGRTDWRLTIAGDGECLPALKELVAARGLTDVVVSHVNEPVAVLKNQARLPADGGNHWLGVELRGRGNRDVVGAKVVVEFAGGR